LQAESGYEELSTLWNSVTALRPTTRRNCNNMESCLADDGDGGKIEKDYMK